MYESRDDQLISRGRFVCRLLGHLLAAMGFIALSLVCAVLGYIWIEDGVHWHDAMLNVAMIASGIGPTMLPSTVYGKVFLAAYSAYISFVFVAVLGVVMAPALHRILHAFHLDADERPTDRGV